MEFTGRPPVHAWLFTRYFCIFRSYFFTFNACIFLWCLSVSVLCPYISGKVLVLFFCICLQPVAGTRSNLFIGILKPVFTTVSLSRLSLFLFLRLSQCNQQSWLFIGIVNIVFLYLSLSLCLCSFLICLSVSVSFWFVSLYLFLSDLSLCFFIFVSDIGFVIYLSWTSVTSNLSCLLESSTPQENTNFYS